jgi:DNA-directed RNA polymerase specialized sigma24 family protein
VGFAEAVERAREGSGEGCERLAEEWLLPLSRRVAGSLLFRAGEDREEAAAEALAAMWRVLPEVDVRGEPEAFLWRVGRNAAVSYLRRGRRWRAATRMEG